jgi:hypothetical protein
LYSRVFGLDLIPDVRREVIPADILRPVINPVYVPIPEILAEIYRFLLELAAGEGLEIGQ